MNNQPSPSFQAVTIKPLSGKSKAGNDYSMLIVAGIFTSEQGVVEMGEISFMLGRDRTVFPDVKPGQKYTPVIAAQSRDGKLEFKVTDLKPLAVAAARVAS